MHLRSQWTTRSAHLLRVLALVAIPISCAPATPPPPSNPRPPAASQPLTPALTREWAHRLTSTDPADRELAAAELTRGADRSLPLLRQLLASHNQNVRQSAFDIAYRIGPPAIGLLAGTLQDDRVATRRQAIDLLIDLAPDTESIQPALCRALKDPDAPVARDAARALGALRERAAPSVPPLIESLSDVDAHVRLYAAEALASIGPRAAPAATALATLLHDPIPGVRWAACEGLASIGPAASPAVPSLAAALADETLYVRICAAGALGSIGPAATAAIPPLQRAATDPALHPQAQWALDRIAAAPPPLPSSILHPPSSPSPLTASPPPLPSSTLHPPSSPSPPSPAATPPTDWDPATRRNIAWSVELGAETYGRPVFADGVVYIGTDNAHRFDPAFTDDCGVLVALRAADGAFLWQDVAPRGAQRGLRQFLLPSTTSAPYIEGDRLYYLTAECQLRCLDIHRVRAAAAAPPSSILHPPSSLSPLPSSDLIWQLDLCARLGVFPHEACNSEVLPLGDLLIVGTSNGQNEGHTRVPSPRAPSLIAVDKRTGTVVWQAIGAGEHILHGQWCSPTAAIVNGRTQVLFGGGDGVLRAYDAPSGQELWRFDGNPPDAPWRPRPGVFSRGSIIASPVFALPTDSPATPADNAAAAGRVFIAMGEDPTHGDGPSLLHAVAPDGHGDVTHSPRRLWTCPHVGRIVATPVLAPASPDAPAAPLLFVADLGGVIHCLDSTTGDVLWIHDTHAPIWGCLCLAGQTLYAGNTDGTMTLLRASRAKHILATIEMDEPLYSRPTILGDAMYLATARRLYLIRPPSPATQPTASLP